MGSRVRDALVLVGLVPLLIVAGCSGGAEDEPTSRARIAIDPAPGARQVRPDSAVTVTVNHGKLSEVRVVGEDGQPVEGALQAGKTVWRSDGRLGLGARYSVTAKAADGDGLTKSTEMTFRTLQPSKRHQLKASSIAPLDGSTVGVAQPLAIGFNGPVHNRAAIQEALDVSTEPKVEGAWYWIGDEYVHFRPKHFWPAGTEVTLDADIAGVDAGEGSWGAKDRTVSFTIGREQIVRVDVTHQQLTVEREGKVVRTAPVTTGKPGWETRNGIKVIMAKESPKYWTNEAIDAPEEYSLTSDWALRMTNSGEFLHDNTWSDSLGSAASSHGCVGMYPSDAKWLYENSLLGDPVVVTGSPVGYEDLWNLYADWNVSWREWSAGNA
ncbi:MAG: L,D-transpeptidase [Carbonactinosporaceae bacterium]